MANKEYIMGLSEENVAILRDKVYLFRRTLDDVCIDTVRELATDAATYATLLNSVAPRSGDSGSTVEAPVYKNHGKTAIVAMVGKDAIYDEFGTGEEGAYNPHPMKNNFQDLNPYNSGPFVSSHVDEYGQHYWYYRPMAGQPFFEEDGKTYGIPSGKQMYHTLLYIRGKTKGVTKSYLNKATDIFLQEED